MKGQTSRLSFNDGPIIIALKYHHLTILQQLAYAWVTLRTKQVL